MSETDPAAEIAVELVAVAKHLSAKAKAETCDIQDTTKALAVLKDIYAILTKGGEKDDKEPGRRPTTMAGMKARIGKASLSVVPDREEDADEPT